MGISRALANRHIAHWQEELKHPLGYSYRTRWPSFLFRHERLENAAAILRTGTLLSRSALGLGNFVDVAPAEIIAARRAAQAFARLYFRPRTPTQYHIEGIRKAPEIYRDRHAPVLVSFVFRATSVLCDQETSFSDGNMQSGVADVGNDDAFFRGIPFAKVYHEGPFVPGSADGVGIIHARCAEVLVPSPLALAGNLQAVLCRSTAERQTLLHMTGALSEELVPRIRVFRELGIFGRQFTYVETVSLTRDGLSFSLHPRIDSQPVELRVEVRDSRGHVALRATVSQLDASKRWRIRGTLGTGSYTATIWLEGELAYQATSEIDDLPF